MEKNSVNLGPPTYFAFELGGRFSAAKVRIVECETHLQELTANPDQTMAYWHLKIPRVLNNIRELVGPIPNLEKKRARLLAALRARHGLLGRAPRHDRAVAGNGRTQTLPALRHGAGRRRRRFISRRHSQEGQDVRQGCHIAHPPLAY